MRYEDFIARKSQEADKGGFDPVFMPDFLFDFQRYLTTWAIQGGRSAILADCGMGKAGMGLVWAQNVVKKTGKPVLILTPLAVSHQLTREGDKFKIACARSNDGTIPHDITVTNYERLSHFKPDDFGGVVADESSRIKNMSGATRIEVTEFMRRLPYRLLCTATAAPNDYYELGTSSEALGYLGATDMITKFFKEDTIKDYLGWGRKSYRFRGHSEEQFWRWVCSWARVCRKPSDLGFDDGSFVLPPLVEHEHIVKNSTPRPGMLFSLPADDLQEQREERRITIRERCESAAELAAKSDFSVIWCHLNDEGDALEKIVPDAVQVSGSMSDDEKEEKLLAFQAGQIKRLVTKPKIASYGLNWQHCANVITFPSHSWEQYYQAVRRCWRFGQKRTVNVHVVTTQGEVGVLANLKRKAAQADKMFEAIARNSNNALKIERSQVYTTKEEIPSWLSSNKK